MAMGKYYLNGIEGLKITFRSLRYRNYRLFFTGQSISLVGTWIQRIAMPWLVYHQTNSVVLLGVVDFAGQIPAFLLAPFAGVLTDQWNRYRILIVTQILSMVQALALATLYFTGVIAVWHIILLSILLGCINAFDMPSRHSFVVDMVEKKEDLGNAIALNSSMVNGARLIGPSIAGLIIAVAGEGICFLINGLSYLVVIASLLMMNVSVKKSGKKYANVFREFKQGFSYTFGFKPIKSVILLLGLISLMGMPYTILIPVFAKDVFHGGAHTFGFLIGAAGLGAFAGAIYLASRRSVLGLGRLIPISAGIFGAGLVLFAFSRVYPLSLALMVIVGIGMMMQMASSNTIIQTIVDDDMRGRVMSFYTMAFMGMAPLGSLLAGGMAKSIGAPNTLIFGGVSCIIGALLFWKNFGDFKRMIRPVYVKLGIVPDVPDMT